MSFVHACRSTDMISPTLKNNPDQKDLSHTGLFLYIDHQYYCILEVIAYLTVIDQNRIIHHCKYIWAMVMLVDPSDEQSGLLKKSN